MAHAVLASHRHVLKFRVPSGVAFCMRIGLFSVADHYPAEIPRELAEFYNELEEQARLAEEMGFYSFWIAEHHFHEYGAVPRPSILLSVIGAKTKVIKLGSAVAVLPFDNPLRAAEDFAMLDIISGGRLELGVGSGYLQHEFEGFGIDVQERRERFDESLSIIRCSWQGERFSAAGKFFTVNKVKLNVQPMNPESVPIFIAVLRNEAAKFVGRQKFGMMMIPYATTERIEELADTCAIYRSEFAANGGAPENARIQFGLHCYCAPTTEEARTFARPYMDRYVRTRLYAKQRCFDELIDKNLIAVGDPEEVLRVARLYEKAGLTDFLMLMNFGGLPHEQVKESIRLIGAEVIPRMKTSQAVPQ